MSHALIIDDNMVVSRAIQSCLATLGFSSFDRTWTDRQAETAAAMHAPNLIVIGDDFHTGSMLSAARKISGRLKVPVLMVTGDPCGTRDRLAKTHAFAGPFLLNEIEAAAHLARAGVQPGAT